jgi:hypothetical protein
LQILLNGSEPRSQLQTWPGGFIYLSKLFWLGSIYQYWFFLLLWDPGIRPKLPRSARVTLFVSQSVWVLLLLLYINLPLTGPKGLGDTGWLTVLLSTLMTTEIPDEQTKRKKREKKKHTYSQTSRIYIPKELQLHHNH